MAYYVDISDVPLDFLEFMGYRVEGQDDRFILLTNKGEHHVISKGGKKFLRVEDINDAKAFEGRKLVKAPPKD